MWRLRNKIMLAGLNGFIAFLFGLSVQTAFIRFAGLGHFTAYAVQTAFSTQLSFLLARYVTWGDRAGVRFFRALARYNVQQFSTVLLSIVLFAALDAFGIHYALANFMVTIMIAPLTFVAAHKWSIAEPRRRAGTIPWPGDETA